MRKHQLFSATIKHLVYQKTDKVFQFGSYNGFLNYIVSEPFCGFIVFETSLVLAQIQFIRIYHVLIATIGETFGVLVTPDQCVNQLLIIAIQYINICTLENEHFEPQKRRYLDGSNDFPDFNRVDFLGSNCHFPGCTDPTACHSVDSTSLELRISRRALMT